MLGIFSSTQAVARVSTLWPQFAASMTFFPVAALAVVFAVLGEE